MTVPRRCEWTNSVPSARKPTARSTGESAARLREIYHVCAVGCRCPTCGRTLWYAPTTGLHTCPDMQCPWRDRK